MRTRNKFIIIASFLLISAICYASFTNLVWNNTRAKAAVSLQTSTAYSLGFNQNVGYTFHAFGADSGLYYINTYGNINKSYILLKRDTLRFGDVKNTGINFKNVVLRNGSVDYLAGYNIVRFTVSAGACPTADSTSAMGYVMQLMGY